MDNKKKKKFEPSLWSEIILDSIVEGVFTVDKKWRIKWFNKAAEKITGFSKKEAIGSFCFEIFRSTCCERGCVLQKTFDSGETITNRQVDIIRKDGKSIPISISTAILRDSTGEIIGGVETFRDLSEIVNLRKILKEKNSFFDIISKNHIMHDLFKLVPKISESNTTILIEGASGTGKELFARAIHNSSPRKNKEFVPINCAAIPENLLESELFGYEKGAFTGAEKAKIGLFKLADGGTLFLDEIGELPLLLQGKLLRAIEEKKISPIGGRGEISVDVRIVSATNRDLKKLVEEKLFREDLYYRLNVIKLSLPPLKERREDIPLLVEHFLCKFGRSTGRNLKQIHESGMSLLLNHKWSGNIRELANAIEHAVILSNGEMIFSDDFPSYLKENQTGEIQFSGKKLEEIEKQAIENALIANDYKVMKTCRELGIHKNTLRRKILKYGLENN